jgi:acyl-CoA synthetase (AMP-forming)/AMP-acid ligase II
MTLLGNMMDQPLLISSQLEHAARYHGNVEIITRTVEGPVARSTWAEVARRSKKLANALVRLGVKPGDRVATIAWNTQRHLELYFAVSSMGAVLHTINPRLSMEQFTYVVDHAEDTLLFFDATFLKIAQACYARKSRSVRGYVALSATSDAGIDGLLDYEQLLAAESDVFEWPRLDEHTASSLCYTSGTSGEPKGVLYSHRSTVLHSYATCMADTLGLSGADVVLPVVPMFHVNAWGVPYAAAMVGAKLVLPGPGLDGKSLLELIEGERVTSLLGVPTVWMNLLTHMKSTNHVLTHVKKVVIGGSACPASMIEAFERTHHARVIHAWGMTETSPVGTANLMMPKHADLSYDDAMPIKLKQGRAVFGVDLRIVDESGVPLPHDGKRAGDLQVKGPWVARSYFKQDVKGSHQDGWFVTGDIATIDGDAFMQITDRSKDVIKSGGEWISSIDVENAALGCPGVAQAATIGVPSTKWGERPLLVVVKAPGKDVTADEVRAYLETKIMKWWVPDAIEFVDALPIGPTGKILKRALREKFKGVTVS